MDEIKEIQKIFNQIVDQEINCIYGLNPFSLSEFNAGYIEGLKKAKTIFYNTINAINLLKEDNLSNFS